MATVFVDGIRLCLKEGGYAKKQDEREKGGKFLVGFQGRLFCVDSDYQVQETLVGYDAVGSGDDLALGALFATRDNDDPEARITLALQAAAFHNADVREPFIIHHIAPVSAPQLITEPVTQPNAPLNGAASLQERVK